MCIDRDKKVHRLHSNLKEYRKIYYIIMLFSYNKREKYYNYVLRVLVEIFVNLNKKC